MSRPLRIEYAGAVYHITSRGNGKNDIFFKNKDRHIFLSLLSKVVRREKWICYAYCLMNNHYHLLIETKKPNLSIGMRELNGVYAQGLNFRRNSAGHVFQSRYKSILVEKDSYLLELCRYIVLNPVRARIVDYPEEWIWSSYRATLGLTDPPKYLNVKWVLSNFNNEVENYEKFVLEGIDKENPLKNLKGRIFLGGKKFIKKHEKILAERKEEKEFTTMERFAGKPTLEEIFENIKTQKDRDKKVLQAYDEYRYTLKEIGNFLKIHYSTVSKIIKKTKNS